MKLLGWWRKGAPRKLRRKEVMEILAAALERPGEAIVKDDVVCVFRPEAAQTGR